jgi:hypothetical protein
VRVGDTNHQRDFAIQRSHRYITYVPRGDVVVFGADSKDWRADVGHSDRCVTGMIMPFGQIVVQDQFSQIFGMHSGVQAWTVHCELMTSDEVLTPLMYHQRVSVRLTQTFLKG